MNCNIFHSDWIDKLMKKHGSCAYCGKIDSLINSLCEECYVEDMTNLKVIRSFLRKDPFANAMKISIETGISINKITRLMKTGTLRLID